MRIIPDRGPGYSDALFTVKRYLLASLDASSGERVGAIQREAMLARGESCRIISPLPLPDAYRKRQYRLKARGLVELEGTVVRAADDQGKGVESALGQPPQAVVQECST
jgi:hypothetical protein